MAKLERPETAHVINAWLDAAEQNRGTERFQISLAAFREIVAGRMPTIAELAERLSVDPDALAPLVRQLAGAGRLTLDATGTTITGAGGLSLVESRHRVDMLGRTYWVWCALDAIGIPVGIERDATIHSRCADTGEPVNLAIRDESIAFQSPADLVVSLIPPKLDESLHDSCCSEIGFYQSAGNVPGSMAPVTLAQAIELGRHLWRDGIPL